jgi:hypothetical protein
MTRKEMGKAIILKLKEYALPSTDTPLETRIRSIENALNPNIAIGIYLQEAFNIYIYALADKEALCSKGLDMRILEELPRRIDFAREMEARWYSVRYLESPAEKELKRVRAIVDKSRNALLAAMEYAFHGDSWAGAVDHVKKGDGEADYTQDLWDIVHIVESNAEVLTAACCDMKHLDILIEQRKIYADLVAQCTLEQEDTSAHDLRDKAYTFVFAAVEEIRRAAKHAFWEDKKHLKGYAIEYFRKSSRKK